MRFATYFNRMNTENLLQSLIETSRQIMNRLEQLRSCDLQALTWKQNKESWSVLECIEHLNLYGDYYLSQIDKAIAQSKYPSEAVFKSGWLGNYFANSMLPKEKLNKMQTFKDKNPLNANLNLDVLDRFADQQMTLLNLLNKSRQVSLNKVKIETSISKWIKMNLGDTFRFYIHHQLRHFNQIENVLKMQNSVV